MAILQEFAANLHHRLSSVIIIYRCPTCREILWQRFVSMASD
jgi:hypothetical protein